MHRGVVDGVALCRMFNRATCGQRCPPTSVRTMIRVPVHQWQANLRILNIREIKTVPYVPRSHPVVERLIGTVPRECLDRTGRNGGRSRSGTPKTSLRARDVDLTTSAVMAFES